jgi:hypothetical protein
LLRGSVYSALDRLESFREVADGEVVSETPAHRLDIVFLLVFVFDPVLF